jgi:hypothetical protein
MAPLPSNLLSPRRVVHNYSNNSLSGGGIGGTAIACILLLMLVVFICVYIIEYRKSISTFLSASCLLIYSLYFPPPNSLSS